VSIKKRCSVLAQAKQNNFFTSKFEKKFLSKSNPVDGGPDIDGHTAMKLRS